ncbi:hypothetical protein NON00_03435 [Roseomonas sp. GC11]|uniref:hypothetical protein n=1 Tax=Roseomonas sp. GC11 TaxID=2950546 RepID=UPI00210AE4FE|nr:hypothetical protein [Roseomonas sp. GC11]MCQ4158976.1 hypothetical protein [Roseomonas sp. GC11]
MTMPSSPAPRRAPAAQAPHRQLAAALAGLHRTLLNAQAIGHPAAQNPYALLQAVMHDPAFAWLRAFSDLMVKIDEAGAKGATPSPEAMQGFLLAATALAEGGAEAPEAHVKLRGFLLRREVATAHAALRETLAQLRASHGQ